LILILIYRIKAVGRIHFGRHISIIAPVTVVISRLRSGRSGVRIPLRERSLIFFKTSRLPLESTQPHIQWVWGSFMGVKRPEPDVNY